MAQSRLEELDNNEASECARRGACGYLDGIPGAVINPIMPSANLSWNFER